MGAWAEQKVSNLVFTSRLRTHLVAVRTPLHRGNLVLQLDARSLAGHRGRPLLCLFTLRTVGRERAPLDVGRRQQRVPDDANIDISAALYACTATSSSPVCSVQHRHGSAQLLVATIARVSRTALVAFVSIYAATAWHVAGSEHDEQAPVAVSRAVTCSCLRQSPC